MAFNTQGRFFCVTTFGESHGPALGVVVEGVPPGTPLDLEAIQRQLDRRRPGHAPLTSPRREPDKVQVLGGLRDGHTLATPLVLVVWNRDQQPGHYDSLRDTFRPGHADLTYLTKYGIRDHRGGGRSSGRETVARVAAGAVARALLEPHGVTVMGVTVEVAGVPALDFDPSYLSWSWIGCGDPRQDPLMEQAILRAMQDGDSVGGVVEVRARGVPEGWGAPPADRLDSRLAEAMMSIGAVKAVELGSPGTGRALPPSDGGLLQGCTTGEDIALRLAVKPTPSIQRPQRSVDRKGRRVELVVRGRHDPCIVPRLVPVAEAMLAMELAEAMLATHLSGPQASR